MPSASLASAASVDSLSRQRQTVCRANVDHLTSDQTPMCEVVLREIEQHKPSLQLQAWHRGQFDHKVQPSIAHQLSAGPRRAVFTIALVAGDMPGTRSGQCWLLLSCSLRPRSGPWPPPRTTQTSQHLATAIAPVLTVAHARARKARTTGIPRRHCAGVDRVDVLALAPKDQS